MIEDRLVAIVDGIVMFGLFFERFKKLL